MTKRIDLSDSIIEWLKANIDLTRLNEKDQTMVKKWLNKEAAPTYRQLTDISKKTLIPFGYFLLDTPPEEDLSFIDHRTIDSIKAADPSRELIETYNQMLSIQDWMHDYMVERNEEKNEYIGKAAYLNSPKEIAAMIKEDLQNSSDIYSKKTRKYLDYKNAISNLGILVMNNGVLVNKTNHPLDIEEFRGFALSDDYAPLIFINGNDSENGKTFTLLHELAHLYLNNSDLFNMTYMTGRVHNKKEQIANAVAAEILLPVDAFMEAWNSSRKPWNEKVNEIAKQFACSQDVVTRRAYDQEYISKDQYNQMVRQSKTYYQKTRANRPKGGGDFYANVASKIDNRFLSILEQSVHDGSTQYTTAYRLTGTNRKTYGILMDFLHGREAA